MADACCGGQDAPPPAAVDEPPARIRQVRELRWALVCGVFLAVSFAAPSADLATGARWAAVVAGAITFVPGALRALLGGRLGVGLLMTVAAVGALALGELIEAATLVFLFSVAEGLEGYAVARTRHGLRALLDLVPPTATLIRQDSEHCVPVADLAVGDLMLVRPGERVATDAVVVTGNGAVDTSVVTGESVPVEVSPGDTVFAGTVNGTAALRLRVSATAADNSLARIVHTVQEAQERKGAGQRLAERIARPLVPGVLILAALVAAAGSLLGDPGVWIERSLVVLVAAAPCAFALSVPVAVLAAVGAASRGGVLVKGGAAVEALGAVRTVAFDKTGTLTRNQPVVVDIAPAPGQDRATVLATAAALEADSEHPLAAAVLAASPSQHPTATEVEAVPGAGVRGKVNGATARLGSPTFVDPGPDLADDVARLQNSGATVIVVEHDTTILGAIAVRDEIRPEAAEAVATLQERGITVVMLTGDNARTAAAIGAAAGITDVRAQLLPQDKARIVAELRDRGPVAMVGDGINDAPALATADTGIAMGAMGSDVAIEASDVALMGEDLRRIPDALAHTRAARRVLRQNLVLSGGILLTLVPLAAGGVLGLAAVVAMHEVAEVLVIANGIRAGRRRHLQHRTAEPRIPTTLAEPLPAPRTPTAEPTTTSTLTTSCACCEESSISPASRPPAPSEQA
ncbi:heavy metal translocating P-type ATPase [Streptomyces bohaiensis]|uniref:Cation-translocating P-type ATPase n=1 Tax=Streptomyces bohaiensis TaxID=1431344 RepID=A0ABX1CII8_9ACTN|nr:cation-translocating P-type ATPase [Streptomyces bohaiensis]NJQ17277.1 cation-translocating P-type ATPase [Streptomyces bohaiensis]